MPRSIAGRKHKYRVGQEGRLLDQVELISIHSSRPPLLSLAHLGSHHARAGRQRDVGVYGRKVVEHRHVLAVSVGVRGNLVPRLVAVQRHVPVHGPHEHIQTLVPSRHLFVRLLLRERENLGVPAFGNRKPRQCPNTAIEVIQGSKDTQCTLRRCAIKRRRSSAVSPQVKQVSI